MTLIDTLARLHLKGEARRYALGYLWWIVEPMLYVAVFYLVFEKLLQSRQPDFLYFLMVGKLVFIWFLFSNKNRLLCLLFIYAYILPRE